MGLTPKVVVEMFRAIQAHKPRNSRERTIIAETRSRVLMSHRKIRSVTRFALYEGSAARTLNEFIGIDDILKYGSEQISGATGVDLGLGRMPSKKDDIPEEVLDARDLSGDEVTQRDLSRMTSSSDVTSGVLACNTQALEIFQTFLAVSGVFGDITLLLGIPIGMASDLVNACINLSCKHYFHAFLDLVAIVPVAGDLGKIFYANRLIKTLGVVEDMPAIRGVGTIAEQVEDATKVILFALKHRMIGPRVSRAILSLHRVFKSAKSMAARLTGLLKRTLDVMIAFFERIKKGADEGKLTMKAANWALSKAPVNVHEILVNVRDRGVTQLREFIEHLFSRQQVQYTATGMQLKQSAFPGDEESAAPAPEVELTDRERLSMRGQEMKTFDFGGSSDSAAPVFDFGGSYSRGAAGTPAISEGKTRKKKAKKISLVKAMDGDDSVIDETSTTASISTFALPLGMAAPGPHKSLDKLIPGYEFAQGRYPYSR